MRLILEPAAFKDHDKWARAHTRLLARQVVRWLRDGQPLLRVVKTTKRILVLNFYPYLPNSSMKAEYQDRHLPLDAFTKLLIHVVEDGGKVLSTVRIRMKGEPKDAQKRVRPRHHKA